MAKLKLKMEGDRVTFIKGSGSFSVERETTEFDLKKYFALAKIGKDITRYNKTEYGWEFFNKEGKKAWCTHKDLIEKLRELE